MDMPDPLTDPLDLPKILLFPLLIFSENIFETKINPKSVNLYKKQWNS